MSKPQTVPCQVCVNFQRSFERWSRVRGAMRRLWAEVISEGSRFGLCDVQLVNELTNVVQDRKDIRKVSAHLLIYLCVNQR
jgi:hypothetical protein